MILFNVLLLLLGFALILLGAEGFIRGGSGLAKFFHIPEFVIGATVVAFGTSLPELVTSTYAAFKGIPVISLSNIVGSNIFNITLVLGLSAMVRPLLTRRDVFRRDAPTFLFAVVLLFLLGLDGSITSFDGFLFLALFVSFLYWLLREKEEADREFLEMAPSSKFKVFLYIIFGIVSLWLGSKMAVDNAVVIARELGVSEWIIGATVVAAGTSLPEFATSFVAFLRGRGALAVGNVIGSNVINILLVVGVASVIIPLPVSRDVLLFDFPFLFFISLILIFMINDQELSRESGFSLFVAYIAYVFMLIKLHRG